MRLFLKRDYFINGLKKLAKKTIFFSRAGVPKKLREAPAHKSVRRKMVRRTFFGWGRRPLLKIDDTGTGVIWD